jgi:hypothetical protein
MVDGYSDFDGEVSGQLALPAPTWTDIDTTAQDEILLDFQREDTTNQGDITIYRSQTDGVLGSAIATLDYDATSFTDSTANVDEVNYYTLRRDTGDATADSIQANTLLPPPGITVQATKFDADLSWSDAATTEVGYRVYRQPQGGSETLVGDFAADTTTYETTRLTVDDQDPSTWTYRVEAYRDGLSAGEETTASEATTFTLPGLNLTAQWELVLPNVEDDAGMRPYIEGNLFDVEVVDTANPFGSYSVGYIDDQEGSVFDTYPRGTRVDVYVDVGGGDYELRFVGFVVERRTTEEQGADTLEVESYTFDQFLRRGTVSQSTNGQLISDALEDIITIDTPVDYNAAQVSVGEDVELTRNYRGEKVENALQSLRQKSVNEEFGVDETNEFYWRPSESTNAPKDLGDADIFAYDIPERGKRSVNEVTVFYAGGDKSVTVDNGADKEQLQSNIGTADPVTLSEEIQRHSITNLDDAIDAGNRYLNQRKPLLTGTVTTFGLEGARPGDVINIQYTPRGLDTEFRIAELEYLWGRAETRLTIVEKRGQQDDLLVNLSDSVKRLGERDTNRDGESSRVTSTSVGVNVASTGDINGTAFTSSRITNTARNKLRDAWRGESPISVSEIAVGTDASAPKRSQNSLGNEVARVSASESLPDAYSADYSASVNESSIREIGVFDSDGDMVARAVVPDQTYSTPASISYEFTIENDPALDGVVTNHGQTAVRDALADNNPVRPIEYGYGDDGTTATESDTALGNELARVTIDELLLQSASTESEFQSVTSLADDAPIAATSSGKLALLQSSFTREGENPDSGSGAGVGGIDSAFSGGSAVTFQGSSGDVSYDFTTEYVIPESALEVYLRFVSPVGAGPEVEVRIDGDLFATIASGEFSTLDWKSTASGGITREWTGGDLAAGNHTLRLNAVGGGTDQHEVDVVAPLDDRHSYTFDNDNGGNSGYLDGPELYPDLGEATLNEATTTRAFDTVTLDSTWSDTSGQQFIAVSRDGGNTFLEASNTSVNEFTFGERTTSVVAKLGLSRYGSRSTATPQQGFQGQSVSDYSLLADILAIQPEDNGQASVSAIVDVGEYGLVGEVFREGGEFDGSGQLLTRASFAEVDLLSTGPERVLSSEDVNWSNEG